MSLELLVSAMNIKNIPKFVEAMNIRTKAIIINQTDSNKYDKYNNIEIYSFHERGVGLSRNNALMRADSDIVVLADDDIHYVDDYEQIIIDEFKRLPFADMIIFNIKSNNPNVPLIDIKKTSRLNKFNHLKYGGARVAFKLKSQRNNNIFFSLLFGGGCKYGSGEDTIFIHDFIKKGLKVYTSKKVIGNVDQKESTWFKGYNEKFFYDKGALYYYMFEKISVFLMIRYAYMMRKKTMNLSFHEILKIMKKGGKEYYE